MSIYLAFPDIPASAIKITPAEKYADFSPHFNLYRGHRYHHGELEVASNTTRLIDFVLGSTGAKTASYLILARADLLILQGVTDVTLQLSGDAVTWYTAGTSAIASNLLIGPRNQDLLLNFTTTSSARYWRVYFNGSTVSKLKFSKLYFGNMFDIGTYPSDFRFDTIRPMRQNFDADSGAVHMSQTGMARYQFIISWEGITEAKCVEFMNLLRPHHNGFFLYAPEQTQILDNNSLVHVKCASFTKEDNEGHPDWNTITCVFEELLG